MQPDTWQRVKQVFQGSIDLEPREREAFLAEACVGDTELSREVRVLFDHLAAAGDFLESPLEGEALAATTDGEGGEETWLGRRLGAYEIVRQLGRGGTSTVYLAVRVDEMYRQKVAIKLLRRGLDTDDVLRRFRQERQILAGLDHPHIARLLDGGTAEDGRPYFVMEYVRGQPIDVYCDLHRLSIRRRLELFRTVCAAVAYAHRNLVVHRDLKPPNILVSDEGVPKLLDFGIAKLLGAEVATASRLSTIGGHRVMTPRYASPEQVRGLPITTAADVYSLGVLLYELLTGHRPYRLADRLAPDAERVICETEPPRPSLAVTRVQGPQTPGTMVGTPGAGSQTPQAVAPTLEAVAQMPETVAQMPQTVGQTPEAVARARGVEPRKLYRQLTGDLDKVVLKALAKEPERRYASAAELADDLQRHLDGQAVRAQRATWGYRTRKLVARHKAAVAAALLVWLALVFGLGVALWQTRVARAERDRAETLLAEAETQRARASQVTSFLVDVFRVVEPGEARGQTPTAEEILARGSHKVRQELAEQPSVRATLMDAIGRVYYGLGLYDEAEQHFDDALRIRRGLYDAEHPDLAESLYHRGWVAHARGDLASAEPYYRQSLAMRRALFGDTDPAVGEILNELAELVLEQGDLEAAEQGLLEALAIRREALGPEHVDVATSLDDLAVLEASRGHYDKAAALHREALAMRRKLLGPIHPAVASTLNGLGQTLRRMGRYDEAEARAREALATWRQIHGDEHRTVAGTQVDLGQVLSLKGEYEAAERLLRESLQVSRRLLGDDHPQVDVTWSSLASLHLARGDHPEAERLYRQVLQTRRRTRGSQHPATLRSLAHHAHSLRFLGQSDAAEGLFRQAIGAQRAVLPVDHPDLSDSLHGLGQVLLERGEAAAAEPLLQETVDIRRRALGEHWRTREAEANLAACQQALGRG
ncbi:MAG: serine/threonine-protein kinase [Acidobacteriota bacterium]